MRRKAKDSKQYYRKLILSSRMMSNEIDIIPFARHFLSDKWNNVKVNKGTLIKLLKIKWQDRFVHCHNLRSLPIMYFLDYKRAKKEEGSKSLWMLLKKKKKKRCIKRKRDGERCDWTQIQFGLYASDVVPRGKYCSTANYKRLNLPFLYNKVGRIICYS